MDMKDIEKMAKGVNIDLKDIEKMAKGANIDLKGIEKMVKGAVPESKDKEKVTKKAVSDESKAVDLLGKFGQMDQNQMTQIMGMLSKLDLKNLDVKSLSKQFGIPEEAIGQVLKMIKK